MSFQRLLSHQELGALVDRFSSGTKAAQIEKWLGTIGLGTVRGMAQITKLYLLSKVELARQARAATVGQATASRAPQ